MTCYPAQGGTLSSRPVQRGRRLCGGCGEPYERWETPSHCAACGWRMDTLCPRCAGRWPRFPGGPDPDAYSLRNHVRLCPSRPIAQTVRNLARMYWKHLTGHGCAAYIRAQEWQHLRKQVGRCRREAA